MHSTLSDLCAIAPLFGTAISDVIDENLGRHRLIFGWGMMDIRSVMAASKTRLEYWIVGAGGYYNYHLLKFQVYSLIRGW